MVAVMQYTWSYATYNTDSYAIDNTGSYAIQKYCLKEFERRFLSVVITFILKLCN